MKRKKANELGLSCKRNKQVKTIGTPKNKESQKIEIPQAWLARFPSSLAIENFTDRKIVKIRAQLEAPADS